MIKKERVAKDNILKFPSKLTDLEKEIKDLTYKIYELLGMKGIVRMDYIVDQKGKSFLIEINSVPGMSNESIVPQMVNNQKKNSLAKILSIL